MSELKKYIEEIINVVEKHKITTATVIIQTIDENGNNLRFEIDIKAPGNSW